MCGAAMLVARCGGSNTNEKVQTRTFVLPTSAMHRSRLFRPKKLPTIKTAPSAEAAKRNGTAEIKRNDGSAMHVSWVLRSSSMETAIEKCGNHCVCVAGTSGPTGIGQGVALYNEQ